MKNKLKLNELKVQSFVTSESKFVLGGGGVSNPSCNNDQLSCNPLCWGRTDQGPLCPGPSIDNTTTIIKP